MHNYSDYSEKTVTEAIPGIEDSIVKIWTILYRYSYPRVGFTTSDSYEVTFTIDHDVSSLNLGITSFTQSDIISYAESHHEELDTNFNNMCHSLCNCDIEHNSPPPGFTFTDLNE